MVSMKTKLLLFFVPLLLILPSLSQVENYTVSCLNVNWILILPSDSCLWNSADYADIKLGYNSECILNCKKSCSCEELAELKVQKLDDELVFSVQNAYPGYAIVFYPAFINIGIPSTLKDVRVDFDEDAKTAFFVYYKTNPLDSKIYKISIIGYNLSEVGKILKEQLKDKKFSYGGWIAFSKPLGKHRIEEKVISKAEFEFDEGLWIYFEDLSQNRVLNYKIEFIFSQAKN